MIIMAIVAGIRIRIQFVNGFSPGCGVALGFGVDVGVGVGWGVCVEVGVGVGVGVAVGNGVGVGVGCAVALKSMTTVWVLCWYVK